MFTAMLDADSLAALVRLRGFESLLDPAITDALTEAGTLLVSAAQANTWEAFMHPTGALAGSITFYVPSPEEVAVSVGVPYGHRREKGFSGQTDSLGRYYANDPARPYLIPALEANEQAVLALVEEAVNTALGRVSVG